MDQKTQAPYGKNLKRDLGRGVKGDVQETTIKVTGRAMEKKGNVKIWWGGRGNQGIGGEWGSFLNLVKRDKSSKKKSISRTRSGDGDSIKKNESKRTTKKLSGMENLVNYVSRKQKKKKPGAGSET